MLIAARVAGPVDVAALQGALDDVVQRHEILRTIVVRDANPRYQQVYPPSPVPLRVRDLPPVPGMSRDVYAEHVILEVNHDLMDVRELPLLRARLERFDDRDSVLILITHHTASDGWSIQLLLRDLAACYAARTAGRLADLPTPRQYREFVAWEQARLTDPAASGAMDYWRRKLSGAQIFALPTDRPVPSRHSRPYTAHYFAIETGTAEGTFTLAAAMRSSTFMVLLAAFNVLTHQITGTTDPVISTFSNGRNEARVRDMVGSIMNVLPLRTDFGACATFRDVVARTRQTCLEAYSHEIPVEHIERELPELMQPLSDPGNCYFTFGMFQPAQFDDKDFQIGDSSYQVLKRVVQEPESAEIPEGFAWHMDVLPSGELTGRVLYNRDEFDERTVIDWVTSYQRILAGAVRRSDEKWKAL
jgi:hypothetical protein